MKSSRFSLIVLLSVLVMASSLFWFGCNSSQTPTATITDLIVTNPQAVAQVVDIQNRNTLALMSIDGVVGTGTSTDENGNLCIRIFTAGTVANTGKIAESIDGIPVVVEETGPFFANALTKEYRPVPIGVSVGNNNECASGTIGCQVVKNGVKYILSNNHVLARENSASIGESIVQPGRYDTRCKASGQVATLSDFQPIKFDGSANTMDAAIAQYISGVSVTCATLSAYYGFPGTTVVSPSVGLGVKKVGRTTSMTTGTISSINVAINVGYTHGTAYFTGQFMTSKGFTKSGDSGSLVVTNTTANNPVGLLFAGSTQGNAVCSPIGPVLSKFGVTICNN